jgi:D-inositol-3-phosphate glycosyltransferase
MSAQIEMDKQQPAAAVPAAKPPRPNNDISVALLTGGSDRPYVFGLTKELISKGVTLDLIGSDELDCPEYHGVPRLNFLKLRGDQDPHASLPKKMVRILSYYFKLLRYAATAKPKIFHILWNNKFLHFDRTLLMFYYRLLGKRLVLTVHNVNTAKRDNNDSAFNRFTLRIQYRLADHLFAHTEKMKHELMDEFGVPEGRISVIPLGINNSVPDTSLTSAEARQSLGLQEDDKAILFFGRITPYKGLEYLVDALQRILSPADKYRLMIVGRVEEETFDAYWAPIRDAIQDDVQRGRVLLRAEHVPDSETEVYFKAADVLVLPYRDIYQSGTLFLGYSFGLPALASDVGSLKEEIDEGNTGFVFKPEDPADLAMTIEKYFASELFRSLSSRKQTIRDFAAERHDWDVVGKMTISVYEGLLQRLS